MAIGWFKIWRSIEDNRSWSRGAEYRGLMLTILQKTNWKEGFFQGETIMPGQFPTSAQSLATDLKMSRVKVQRALKVLSRDGFITVKNMHNQYTMITVTNWDTYQSKEEVCEQPVNNQCTTSEHQVRTIEEGKKEERKKTTPPNPQGGKKVSKEKEFKDHLLSKIAGTSFVQYEPELLDFIDYRMSLPASDRYKTIRGINGLLTCVGDLLRAGLDPAECLPRAANEEWKKPSPDYFLKNNRGSAPTRTDSNINACIGFINEGE